MTDEQREIAYWNGVVAFIMGFNRVPVHDPDMMREITQDTTNISARLAEWLRGWDHANLDRIEIEDGVTASAMDVALCLVGALLIEALGSQEG